MLYSKFLSYIIQLSRNFGNSLGKQIIFTSTLNHRIMLTHITNCIHVPFNCVYTWTIQYLVIIWCISIKIYRKKT